MQGLQAFLAAHGLQGLQAFLAAQGLQGLQAFLAAQGLQGLQAFLAAQGLQGLHAFFAAQGLQGLQAFLCFAARAESAPVVSMAVPVARPNTIGKAATVESNLILLDFMFGFPPMGY